MENEPILGTLPALAKELAVWFPEFNGRSLAVAEMKMDRDVKPTIPIILVVLLKEKADHFVNTNRIKIVQDILVEFWLEPKRYVTASGGESPFWAYYNFEYIRNVLLNKLLHWVTPDDSRLEYEGLVVDCDERAVQICVRLKNTFDFCQEDGEHFEGQLTVTILPYTDVECFEEIKCLEEVNYDTEVTAEYYPTFT